MQLLEYVQSPTSAPAPGCTPQKLLSCFSWDSPDFSTPRLVSRVTKDQARPSPGLRIPSTVALFLSFWSCTGGDVGKKALSGFCFSSFSYFTEEKKKEAGWPVDDASSVTFMLKGAAGLVETKTFPARPARFSFACAVWGRTGFVCFRLAISKWVMWWQSSEVCTRRFPFSSALPPPPRKKPGL